MVIYDCVFSDFVFFDVVEVFWCVVVGFVVDVFVGVGMFNCLGLYI